MSETIRFPVRNGFVDKGRGGVLRARVGGGEFLESLQREIMGNRERGGGVGGERFFPQKVGMSERE